MKNIESILKEYGMSIPEGKEDDFKKEFHTNYKTVAEFEKVSDDRENWKTKCGQAEETLKSYDGVSPEEYKKTYEDWKKKAEEAEKEYNTKLAERDFNSALTAELEDVKFSSKAAKDSVIARIKSEGLKLHGDKILGLKDLIDTIRKEDSSAFVSEAEATQARITAKKGGSESSMTREQITAIKDDVKRQAAMAEHIELFPEYFK